MVWERVNYIITISSASRASIGHSSPILTVTRKRGHDANATTRQELGKVFLSGLAEDGQITSVDNLDVLGRWIASQRLHQVPEIRIQLWRPSRHVDYRTRAIFYEVDTSIDRLLVHLFLYSTRGGFHVAVRLR